MWREQKEGNGKFCDVGRDFKLHLTQLPQFTNEEFSFRGVFPLNEQQSCDPCEPKDQPE